MHVLTPNERQGMSVSSRTLSGGSTRRCCRAAHAAAALAASEQPHEARCLPPAPRLACTYRIMPRRMRALCAALSRRRRRARCSSVRSCKAETQRRGAPGFQHAPARPLRIASGGRPPPRRKLSGNTPVQRSGRQQAAVLNRWQAGWLAGPSPARAGCPTHPPRALPKNGRPGRLAQRPPGPAPPRPCCEKGGAGG